jgi:hypothetical protein
MQVEMEKQKLTLDLVRAKLHTRVSKFGHDVDKIFVTSSVINDQGKKVASTSESLPMFFFEQLREGYIPYIRSHLKLYSVRFSVDESYLFNGIACEELNEFGAQIARDFLGN